MVELALNISCQDEPPSNSSVFQDALYDPNLDAQLDSLRNKLTTVIIILLVVNNSTLHAIVSFLSFPF